MTKTQLDRDTIEAALSGLTDIERAAAMQILGELANTGESATLDDLKYSDYEEIPCDIITFITEERYLGRGLWIKDEYTGERKCTVFPYWIEKLQDIFPDNLTTRYNTVVLTLFIILMPVLPQEFNPTVLPLALNLLLLSVGHLSIYYWKR